MTDLQICRDCLSVGVFPTNICPACTSVRLLSHPDMQTLGIAHLDCDAFYAAIEKRDRPELMSKPVIVGGGVRGVVATCCYIARTYGVRSAMPMFKALKACPNAVVVAPRMDVYAAEGRRIRDMMQALTPLVEPVSIDEAYMDLTGSDRLHGGPPVVTLLRLQKQIEEQLNLTVSIGLSANKFLAKTASELDKPRGFSILSPTEAPAFLAPRDVRFIHGVGPKLAEKLRQDGYATIADLQGANLKQLIKRHGESGFWLYERAFGRDNRAVNPHSERKSVSSEITFNEDISDMDVLTDTLWKLSLKVADRAKQSQCEGRTITLKLKTGDFRALSRQASLSSPTQLAQTIFRTARPLLEKAAAGQRFRLIGVGISDLSDSGDTDTARDFGDLADPGAVKRAAAERAMDKARARFGRNAVITGRTARAGPSSTSPPSKPSAKPTRD